MAGSAVELFWMPVGAGTSRLQQASLRLWETVEAARTGRRRARLYHSALKFHIGGSTSTLELMPEFIATSSPALRTGPVGSGLLGRFRLFRYQLVHLPVESLPDEQWAVDSPHVLSEDADVARRMLEMASLVPPYTWGRRVRGTSEMWTSDSVVSWLLIQSGIDMSRVRIPQRGRAPGWAAGIELGIRHSAQARDYSAGRDSR